MFIWDFIAEKIFDQITDWIHAQIVSFLGEFFGMINNMGAELFDFVWVQAIVIFFNYLAWAMFTVGLILAVFETAIAYQNGQGNVGNTLLNILKGFIATSLITTLPIELFKFAISMQTSLSVSIAGLSNSTGTIGELATSSIGFVGTLSVSAIFSVFLLIALGYAVIKVFFSNLKRGGILLTQIAVGSLYMLSVPRGFTDGFIGWCKQIVALCLTTFLQSVFLVAGLMVFKDNLLLGVGLMMSANEIPRIADQFGLDTSTRGNMMGTIYATQSALNIVKTVTSKS
ncbi:conjugal transfer protein TrbL family protein [Erysipelothrix anatis]|uniref:conjugal transfer protein TrbL family protein n=1 Tax=Erysipelothrix anatis TaxID=2683713 RepID=UPI001358F628|nr:conjugal transfer protein TrbL family protein [Erysipelothrix anatis]